MKKYFLLTAIIIASFSLAQKYPYRNYPPDVYGNNDGYNNYGNNGYNQNYDPYTYGAYDYSSANFPDDYYYNYPADYYPSEYYQGYYNDYRKSIIQVNWNRFFTEFNLNPWQVQQIMALNARFGSFNVWYNYYGMNPDRWYYERYYAMQQILGPQIFVVFQNRYYHGINPWNYYRNYRITYYVPRYQVMPRYRQVNIDIYRIKRDRFFENRGNVYNNAHHQNNTRIFREDNSMRNDGGFRNESIGGNREPYTWSNGGTTNNRTYREDNGWHQRNSGNGRILATNRT